MISAFKLLVVSLLCRPFILCSENVIILLNGTSSAGKTSIVQQIKSLASVPFLSFGYDNMVTMFPDSSLGYNSQAHLGFQYLKTVEDGNPSIRIEYGPLGRKASYDVHRFIKKLYDSGFNIIIDEVLFDQMAFEDYLDIFQETRLYLISIKPPLHTAEQRELQRKDRPIGLARGLYSLVYKGKEVDLEIDTSLVVPSEAAQMLCSFIANNPQPHAFARMSKSFKK